MVLADLIFFLIGSAVGSFIGLCAYRIPRNESVVFGASHCDHCSTRLSWAEKLPLVGYLYVRGHSRCCRRPISLRYPMLEAAAGVLFVLLSKRNAAEVALLPGIAFVSLLLLGMLIDLDHKIIPDKITLTGILIGLLKAATFPPPALGEAVVGVVVCGGFLFLGGKLGELLFNKSQAMGGGDIKFAAMIGAFLGWQLGLTAVILASFVATAFGLVQILVKRNEVASHQLVFGPFLAWAALTTLLWGEGMLRWYFSTMEGIAI